LKTYRHFQRIFLIGFPGVGKTSVGKKLATILGYTFIDTDTLFEAAQGCTIIDFFEQYGEEAFRKKEYEILKSTLLTEDVVIATGGGTPCYANSLSLMLDNGHVLYLKATPKMLYERLVKAHSDRPLMANKSGLELLEYIYDMLQKRESLYNQAHSTVDALNLKSPQKMDCLSQWLVKKGKWQVI
jgi:shikimate kinase